MVKDKERRSNKRYKMKENKKYPYKKNRKNKYTEGELKFEKASMWGFFFGWCVGVSCFLMVILLMFMEPFFEQDLNNVIVDRAFKIVATSWEDTEVVNSLTYLCSLKEIDLEKVNCVYDFITYNMVVAYHDKDTNALVQPEEIFTTAAVCRDTSVLFMAIMNRMNITNNLVEEPGHVYNRVFVDNYVCDIDVVNEGWVCNEDKN